MEIVILTIIVLALLLALIYVYNYDNKIIEIDNLIISGQKELISRLEKENEELKKIK